jgi:lipopolysaccharide heptosyltransferase II
MVMKSILKKSYLNIRASVLKTLSLFFVKNKSPLSLRNIQSILFIRIDRVGDMVLSTPAFRAIKAALPQVHLTVMASPINAPILKNNSDVDDIIIYDRFASLYEKIRFIIQIRSHQFSLAIDPHTDYELKTACLTSMSGATHRIGYAACGREIFFNCSSPRIEKNMHFVDVTLDLLKYIGIPAKNKKPTLNISKDEHTWANKWIHENGFQNKKIIAVHPGAYYETQRWLPEYYAELIRLILRQTKTDVVLFGGSSDSKFIADIQTRNKNDICTYIQDDLRKFFAILSQCDVLICNNSGPLHSAVALNIPTISFMGPTVKELWMPLGDNHHVFRKDNLPCIGCSLGYCKIKTHDCMRLIKPSMVFEAVEYFFRPIAV